MDSIIWIILAVVVLIVVVALIASQARKRRDVARRDEAEQLRHQAAEHDRDLREREAEAASADAKARKVRAEADERAAEARRLEVEAERRGERRAESEHERDERLRRADALDPDVRTDRDGRRLDEVDDDHDLLDPYGNRGERRLSGDRDGGTRGERHLSGDRDGANEGLDERELREREARFADDERAVTGGRDDRDPRADGSSDAAECSQLRRADEPPSTDRA